MLKALLKDAMDKSLAYYNEQPERWNGGDWWQLSPGEAEVFEIVPQRWAALLPVWEAYEFFTGRTCGWDEGVSGEHPDVNAIVQAERDLHPEWVSLNLTPQVFMLFAKHYAGVRLREAKAMFSKMEFWAVRVGVHAFADEWN